MADTSNASVPGDAVKAVEDSTRPVDVPVHPVVVEAKPVNGDGVAVLGDAAQDTKPTTTEGAAITDASATDAKPSQAITGDDAVAPDASAANDAPASSKKGNHNRRKSGASIAEHKKKTPSKKKKVAPELHLNVQPGEYWFVAMRGYQPWPVVVCDEEMLPEILLSKRPVSAKRIDGTYREDYLEDGKNAKDRRYPIMFLGTNEFAWQVNTELQPFDLEEVKKDVDSGNNTKKSKALWEAYIIAAENHDLSWFKEMLSSHEQAVHDEDQAAKEKKAAKRKSTAAAEESEDVEMDDAAEDGTASTKKTKASKKRKAESEGEQEKPAKTPKTKLKLNNKTPKESSAAKPKKETKQKKSSKAKSESEEVEPVVEEKPMTEAERLEKREKSVLYLRHRLQKGFLSRDQAPKEEEMDNMSDYLKQLEAHQDLEAEVIKKTKVHKVLKAIIKLSSIPKEDEHQFKKRSNELLTKWGGALAADTETTGETTTAAEPATNGVKHDHEKSGAEKETNKATDTDGDVAMAEAAPSADGASAAVEVAVDTVTV